MYIAQHNKIREGLLIQRKSAFVGVTSSMAAEQCMHAERILRMPFVRSKAKQLGIELPEPHNVPKGNAEPLASNITSTPFQAPRYSPGEAMQSLCPFRVYLGFRVGPCELSCVYMHELNCDSHRAKRLACCCVSMDIRCVTATTQGASLLCCLSAHYLPPGKYCNANRNHRLRVVTFIVFTSTLLYCIAVPHPGLLMPTPVICLLQTCPARAAH